MEPTRYILLKGSKCQKKISANQLINHQGTSELQFAIVDGTWFPTFNRRK